MAMAVSGGSVAADDDDWAVELSAAAGERKCLRHYSGYRWSSTVEEEVVVIKVLKRSFQSKLKQAKKKKMMMKSVQ